MLGVAVLGVAVLGVAVLGGALGVAVAGCSAPAPIAPVVFGVPADAPASDPPGEACLDLGQARVCRGPAGAHRVPRPVPAEAPPDAEWRCAEGPPRRCVLLPRRPFVCTADSCVQDFARAPDDADWECADVEGLVVCRDRAPPAGIVPGPPEPGWICGEGRPRICLDPSPDRPGAGNYDCRFEHEPVPARRCRPRQAATLGGPCGGQCPPAMECVEGICAPVDLGSPDCWTAADCETGGRCVLARCTSS